jgi:hypothetical protein
MHLRKRVYQRPISSFGGLVECRPKEVTSKLIGMYFTFLTILLAGDIETNPGPSPIKGICRTCGSEAVEETARFSLTRFLNENLTGICNTFTDGEKLKTDHELNPKFICSGCAKRIRERSHLKGKEKRQKYEKRPLPTFIADKVEVGINKFPFRATICLLHFAYGG